MTQLLAIHPDYLLRNNVLRRMNNRRVALTHEGRWSVALGLLRDGQIEMALEYMDEMAQEAVEVTDWVFAVFVFALGNRGFVGEAAHIMHQWCQRADSAGADSAHSLSLWQYLLDHCSKSLHYAGTRFVWNHAVEAGTVNPSDGTTMNVLHTAARNGDVDLATQAIQILSARRVKLSIHHYEALVDCYVQNRDLENALKVLCIMSSVGIEPIMGSTRPVLKLLKQSPDLLNGSTDILSTLRDTWEIPLAAINVLVEAFALHGDMDRALALYRDMPQLRSSGPDLSTLEVLLAKAKSADVISLLVAETELFSGSISIAMYEQVIDSIAQHGDLDTFFAFLKGKGSPRKSSPRSQWLSERTLMSLLGRCFACQDPRGWDLVSEARRRGMDIELKLQGLVEATAAAQAGVEIDGAEESFPVAEGALEGSSST